MKKTILTSVVAIAALFALPVSAQTADNSAASVKTEQSCKKGNHVKKACSDSANSRQKMNHKKRVSAFEGITLTESQKESLKALRPARPEGNKTAEKNDSTRVRPDRKKMRADYVNGVKAILTPEQYVVFLENIVVNNAFIPGARDGKHHEMVQKDRAKMKKESKIRKGEKIGSRHNKAEKGK